MGRDGRSRYVVVALRGGLGNQLFQYASGLGLATVLRADLRFDSAELWAGEEWLPRIVGERYQEADARELARLGITRGGSTLRDRAVRRAVRQGVETERRLRGMTPPIVPAGDDSDDPGRYREELSSIDLPAYVRGYLQSERYFAGVTPELVDQLRLPAPPVRARVDARPLVAVSFRRGDYVRLGWALPFGYYEHALEALAREVADPRFVVFGDDPLFLRLAIDWVSRFGPATNAYDLAGDELSHLALYQQCDHCVIANSSFAWWGAWLGDQEHRSSDRIVIAPREYHRFGPDIVPDRWRLIPGDGASSGREVG
jgi:glycosyl transferase family 11